MYKWKLKEIGVAIPISNKMALSQTTDKEGHYIMVKGSTQQE